MSWLVFKVLVGFRFYFIEEELVGYYFFKKVSDRRIDFDFICELDLYKFELWDFYCECKLLYFDVFVFVIDVENLGLDLEN